MGPFLNFSASLSGDKGTLGQAFSTPWIPASRERAGCCFSEITGGSHSLWKIPPNPFTSQEDHSSHTRCRSAVSTPLRFCYPSQTRSS